MTKKSQFKKPLHNRLLQNDQNQNKSKYVTWILFLLIGTFIGFFVSKYDGVVQNQPTKSNFQFVNPYVQTSVYDSINGQELTNFKKSILDYCEKSKTNKDINHISVYFRDFTNGFWFGINEKEKFVPASLAKVPIMIATFQVAEKDSNYLNRKLTYKISKTEQYLKLHPEIDDIRTTMIENETYSIEELVVLMITKSDNEAALMLCEDFGWDHWSALQKRLKDVDISAPSQNNVITVKGYSSFFRILYNASLLNRKYSEKALEILSRVEYDKGIRAGVPANIKLCHKYGERDTLTSPTSIEIRQLHHAAIVYYPGKTYFICIMIKGKNKNKMQNTTQEITTLIYNEVDRQVKNFKKTDIDKDIN